jgi:hypothetical protein
MKRSHYLPWQMVMIPQRVSEPGIKISGPTVCNVLKVRVGDPMMANVLGARGSRVVQKRYTGYTSESMPDYTESQTSQDPLEGQQFEHCRRWHDPNARI